jgi:hypothetical protein
MSYGASVNGVKAKRNQVEGTTGALCRSHNATDQTTHDSTTHSTRGTRPPDCTLIQHGEHARTAAADMEKAMHRAKSKSPPASAEGEANIHRLNGVSSTSLPVISTSRTSCSHPRFISLFPAPDLSVRRLRAFERRHVGSDVRATAITAPCTSNARAFGHVRRARNAGKKAALWYCEIVTVSSVPKAYVTEHTAVVDRGSCGGARAPQI